MENMDLASLAFCLYEGGFGAIKEKRIVSPISKASSIALRVSGSLGNISGRFLRKLREILIVSTTSALVIFPFRNNVPRKHVESMKLAILNADSYLLIDDPFLYGKCDYCR